VSFSDTTSENGIYPEATPTDFAFIGGLNFSVAMLAFHRDGLVAATPSTFTCPCSSVYVCKPLVLTTDHFATRIWHLYLTQGVLVGLGVGLHLHSQHRRALSMVSSAPQLANGISAADLVLAGSCFSFMVRAAISNICSSLVTSLTGLISGS